MSYETVWPFIGIAGVLFLLAAYAMHRRGK